MAMYGKVEYWDERYTRFGESASYDWLQSYGNIRHLLSTESLMATIKHGGATSDVNPPYFPTYETCRVLILGCGNSTFEEDMRNDGWYGDIVNVDFSSVVIDQMKKKYAGIIHDDEQQQGLKFICADITEGLPFEDNSFDLIICKGTLDAILCSTGSTICAKNVISECVRVLADGHGCLFLVSYGNPDSRVEFLEHDNELSHYWKEVSIHAVRRDLNRTGGQSRNDYVYICRKNWGQSNNAGMLSFGGENDIVDVPPTKEESSADSVNLL